MIYVSSAPEDLRQVGSVRRGWEAMGPIPAVTIAASDGRRLQAALASGTPVEVALRVQAAITPAVGRNVVARIPGREPGMIVIGAHYDSWFAGSTDNGAGVAAMLELLWRRAGQAQPRWDLVFVAWDGEELALYGGYDYLRRHADDPVRAVIDLETPAARGAELRGLAHSPSLDGAMRAAELDHLYESYLEFQWVPQLFGGVVPTDLQGAYRAGWPAAATAVDSPYYHTAADTPDKVDLERLAAVVDGFDTAIDDLMEHAPAAEPDSSLWRLRAEAAHQHLNIDVDHPNAPVEITVFKDGFFPVATLRGTTDHEGHLSIDLPAGSFAHVRAGAPYPLAEAMVSLQNTR
jgi:Zn-dependent M28 family amino/carboxypeptidase